VRFKKISFFFIAFATSVLMAHSIIPHHHHYGLVYKLRTACSNECISHNYSDHSHDTENESCCSLNQDILVPDKGLRSVEDFQDKVSDLDFNHFSVQTVVHSSDPLTTPCISPLTISYSEASRYLLLLNRSQGLRAPPLS
jgi:hypothetical protein